MSQRTTFATFAALIVLQSGSSKSINLRSKFPLESSNKELNYKHSYYKPCMKYMINFCLCLLATTAVANEADVIEVKTKCHNECTFYVTIAHQDKGWDHYANKWEVLTPGGKVIATRTLRHPHVHEQPFMRSLSHIKIPADVKKVMVRAHDSIHGYGGKTLEVEIRNRPD